MPNVIAFTPRPRPVAPPPTPPLAGLDLRAHLEEAAATALDAADKIIAALDRIKDEPATDPSLKAMAAHAVQAMTLREPIEAPKPPAVVEPETVQVEIGIGYEDLPDLGMPADLIIPEPLRWHGAGNVVSFVGITLLSLLPGE